jgi:hypothetical protein
VDEFRVRRISISDWVNGEWIETFKIETATEQYVVRDIASVFLGLGTVRERNLEVLLKEKNNAT